ncbi:MAG: type II secretion system protein GspD, partial [Bdellovibrionales bacterium]
MHMMASASPLFKNARWLWIAALAVLVGGCSGSSPDPKPTTGRNPTVAEVPDAEETVRGEEDPPIVTLEVGSALQERRLERAEKLPGSIIIPTTNLNAVPVTTALQAVLTGTDVSLSWDSSSFDDHLVTVMNLSGPLPLVVEKICAAGRVFCSYRHGSLQITDKQTFIVPLPPIAKASGVSGGLSTNSSASSGISGSSSSSVSTTGAPSAAAVASVATAAGNTMADAISDLAGEKAKIDEQGGNIIYTTDVEGQEHVREYLEELRNGRPLVVLQLYIWEVQLNKENAEGINWNSLKVGRIGGNTQDLQLSAPASTFPAVAGGATFGAVTAGRISANIVASFLSTQGRVQTVSNPQITFVSGSSAQFVVGGQTNYISSIGQLVTASNVSGTGGTTTSGVGTNTVATASISTGLSIGVSGAYENGVVFANFNLGITNLQGLNPTNTGGQTIDLPTTTNRQVSTIIRVRPGDNLVMAGMVSATDDNSRQGIPLPGDMRIPMYGDDKLSNTELVIMVKPSVILFSDKVATEELRKKENATPLPQAVMIDKDGAKALALPGTMPSDKTTTAAAAKPASLGSSDMPLMMPAVAPQPELMVSEPNAAQPIPLSPLNATP